MPLLDLITGFFILTAVLALINARYLRLPPSIGVTLGGLLVSLLLVALNLLGFSPARAAVVAVQGVAFDDFVFQGVLSFLLFAGALGVNSRALWTQRWPVITFALFSTLISIALVGLGVYVALGWFQLELPLVNCLLFGALISPTDPVAILGMLKQARVPKRIETLVAGESLFNDGIGVVVFSVLAGIVAASGGQDDHHTATLSAAGVAGFFAQEAFGGLVLGGLLGIVGYLSLRAVDDFTVEVLVTLGVVLACTTIAAHLHVSAPLAAVAAGLLIGTLTERRPQALSSHQAFDGFWHLIDEILNVLLFALLALEIVVVQFDWNSLLLGLLVIPIVLIARAFSVVVPYAVLRRWQPFAPFTRRLLIWGGLRGAISVALAFSVPVGASRDLFLVLTYAVVIFSIVVQGLSVGRLALAAGKASDSRI